MKLVYIASPLRADTPEEISKNREMAVAYCQKAQIMGELFGQMIIPISPIANFSYINEADPKERQKALGMGLALLSRCDEIWVAGDKISEGMKVEINAAHQMKKPILSMGIDSEIIKAAIDKPKQLLTAEHCTGEAEYKGKLLVLKPEALAEWCTTPENQLWVCSHGNGASPGRMGQSVFVENLFDGEKGRWDRHNFYGVADNQKLPEWAQEKWAALNNNENNFDMEMEG